jgi:hypothetical protein
MKYSMLVAGALALAWSVMPAAPALSQASSYDPGNYWEVGEVTIEDGQYENYMDFLNANWKPQQAFMKSKGYILDGYILSNPYKRKGEPDLYLVTIYKQMPTPALEEKMHAEFLAFTKKDDHQLDSESGGRVKMRTIGGTQLLRELVFKK